MKRAWLALLLTICLLLAGCSEKPEARERQKFSVTRMDLFDTVVTLTGYAEDEASFKAVSDALFDEMEQLHRLYDVYHEYDGIVNICTINNHAGGAPMETDARVIGLLLLAKEFAENTDGGVNVAAGSVLRLWHEARSESLDNPDAAYIPNAEDLRRAANHMDIDVLEIDADQNTVRLTDPKARLDVGAIAKGYAVQLVCESLPDGYLISAGGNVFASGPKPDGALWTIGIQDPDGANSEILRRASIARGAVVTSGDYQRYYTVDGRRYHHIIDLETLYPADRWRSVTVFCADSGIADGLSTALFTRSMEDGAALLARCSAEALWVDADGNQFMTDGAKAFLVE